MTEPEPYSTPRGVDSAIKDAAERAAAADPSLDVNRRIQLEYFHRFLSRVFSEAEHSEWVLKGGTGMLARVPSTRATRDIDLYRPGFTLTQALNDLIRLAGIDLGDHFEFQYISHAESIGNDTQPYTQGYQVRFEILIGLSTKGSLQVGPRRRHRDHRGGHHDRTGERTRPAAPRQPPVPPLSRRRSDRRQGLRDHDPVQRARVEPREGPRRPRRIGDHAGRRRHRAASRHRRRDAQDVVARDAVLGLRPGSEHVGNTAGLEHRRPAVSQEIGRRGRAREQQWRSTR